MKKAIALLLSLLLMTALFAGCANNNGTTTAANQETSGLSGFNSFLNPGSTEAPSGTSAVPPDTTTSTPTQSVADNFVGTYEAYLVDVNGVSYTIQEISEQLNTDYGMTMIFCADGTGYDIETYGESETISFSWTRNGNTVTISDSTGSQNLELNNGELLLDLNGSTCHLHKVSDSAAAPDGTGSTPVTTQDPTPVNTSGIAGDYTLTSGIANGTELDASVLGISMSIMLYDDGTGEMEALGNTADLTWTLNGSTLLLYSEGADEPLTATFENGKIYLDSEGATLVFSK